MVIDLEQQRAEAAREIGRETKRLAQRRAAIAEDLVRIAEASELARLAALGAPTAAKVPRGATRMTVVDWGETGAKSHDIELDPAMSARQNLERIFQRARRLRQGEPIARQRMQDAERALVELAAALERVHAAKDEEELEAARAGLKLGAPRKPKPKAKDEPLPPYRKFEAPSGAVWVGRNAKRNDELTFDVAKPYHLWLHARGVPGAHVVVPLGRGRSCPADLLVDAAHLAAHFSDARGELSVELTYAPRKYVRKPRGAPPGSVLVDREKVMVLRVEPERLARLLASEVSV
jgi:predicted ribosome quality control (RQC) complex YloA/Tae2 family protein